MYLSVNSWLTPLQELIAKISEKYSVFFRRMGCAGEVTLSMDQVFRLQKLDQSTDPNYMYVLNVLQEDGLCWRSDTFYGSGI